MSARLLAAAAAVALLGPSSAAQVARGPMQARHARAVYSERLERLLAAWEAADAPRRAACVRLFDEARGPGGPRDAWPDLVALSAGVRVLAGEDAASCGQGTLPALADALDLQVVPGTFEPAGGGGGDLGEPLTVRVYPVAARAAGLAARDVELELRWIAPSGAETRARAEPVRRNAFQPAGFDMYVRAPSGVAGETRLLVPILTAEDGASARGAPVPVECVAGFEPAFLEAHAAFSAGAERALDIDLAIALEELRELFAYGCRTTRGDGAAVLLAHAAARAAGRPPVPVVARPFGPPVPAPLDQGPALFVREPARSARFTVVLPAPSRTAAESLFAGRLGAAWVAAADSAGLRLVAADLPAEGPGCVGALLAGVEARWPGERIALVARGDVIVRFLFERAAWSGPEISAVVLASASSKVGGALAGERALVVGPGAPESAADAPEGVLCSRVELPLPLLEAHLPAHVASFLDGAEGE